jgi:integrase
VAHAAHAGRARGALVHAARHSVASLLIQKKGVKLEQISMLLGHSRIETTTDTYGHLVEQVAAEAALHMDDMIGQHAATPARPRRGRVVALRQGQGR